MVIVRDRRVLLDLDVGVELIVVVHQAVGLPLVQLARVGRQSEGSNQSFKTDSPIEPRMAL